MNEQDQIDCIEAMRAWAAEAAPHVMEAPLPRAGAVDRQAAMAKLAAVVLAVDDSRAAGRREALQKAQEPAVGEDSSAAGRLASSVARLEGEVGEELLQRLMDTPHADTAARVARKNLPVLRDAAAYQFLQGIGYRTAVPFAASVRTLQRLGIVEEAGLGVLARRAWFRAMDRLARVASLDVVAVDTVVQLFSGARRVGGVEALCGKRPKCGACPVSRHCAHFVRVGDGKVEPKHKSIRYWPDQDRPRERLLRNERLSDSDLIAILLRTGRSGESAVDIARNLMREYETLHKLGTLLPEEILKFPGLGSAKAATLLAALELGKRAASTDVDDRLNMKEVSSGRAVFELLRPRMMGEAQERLLVLLLNPKNRIIAETMATLGTVNSSPAHPRELFREAIRRSAHAVIFVHNHPSGDPSPSRDDRTATRRLAEVGKLIGIPVLDHVIIGADRYYSFAENGEIN